MSRWLTFFLFHSTNQVDFIILSNLSHCPDNVVGLETARATPHQSPETYMFPTGLFFSLCPWIWLTSSLLIPPSYSVEKAIHSWDACRVLNGYYDRDSKADWVIPKLWVPLITQTDRRCNGSCDCSWPSILMTTLPITFSVHCMALSSSWTHQGMMRTERTQPEALTWPRSCLHRFPAW